MEGAYVFLWPASFCPPPLAFTDGCPTLISSGGRVIVGFSPVEFILHYNAPPGDCCCHLVLYNKHESASSPCADSVCSSASWSFCAFVFSLLSWLSSLTVSLTFCLILCVQASNCCSAFLFPAFLPKALIHPWLLPLESCCRPAALA